MYINLKFIFISNWRKDRGANTYIIQEYQLVVFHLAKLNKCKSNYLVLNNILPIEQWAINRERFWVT
jgi:hypothetical protein